MGEDGHEDGKRGREEDGKAEEETGFNM